MVVAKLEPQLLNKQLKINIQAVNGNITVFADRDRIEQALVNLLENAMQFSHSNGVINVLLQVQENNALIRIKDNGKGMDEDQLQHIWKRFYKVDKARTVKSGVGIGLSIVKSIMDMHETPIDVKSQPGKGTTFTFLLPLSKEYDEK